MFFWTTPEARDEITYGIGYEQFWAHTCKHFTYSSIYIIRIIMIITLFLPIYKPYNHHKTSRVEKQEDYKPQRILYDRSMQPPLAAENLRFPHHKRNSDKDKIRDITSSNERNQFQFNHHSGAEVKKMRRWEKSHDALRILNNFETNPAFRQSKNYQTYRTSRQDLNRVPKRSEDDENLLLMAKAKKDKKSTECPVSTVLVLRGETATIRCRPLGLGPAPAGTVSWWYDHDQPVTDGRFSVSKTGSLVLQDAQAHDSDKYYCKLSEDDKSFEHILQVYLPKEQTYQVRWQFSTPEPCDDTRLPKLKLALHETLLKQVCAERCTATDLRLSCQFSTDTSYYLDVTLFITGTLHKSILNKCVTKECMEEEMMNSANRGILRLIARIRNSFQCGETRLRYIAKSLRAMTLPSCAAGYGLESERCMPCPPGSYSSSGATECIDCTPGFYQSEYGAQACISCDSGSSPPGSTKKEHCGPNVFIVMSSNNLRILVPLIIILILSAGFAVAAIRWLKIIIVFPCPFG